MVQQTAQHHRRTCLFSGYVQGVGFRYTVQNVAMKYDVGGYVRNLPDGRVELVMEGVDPEMDQLLDEVQQRMGSHIRKVDVAIAPSTGEFHSFSIRH